MSTDRKIGPKEALQLSNALEKNTKFSKLNIYGEFLLELRLFSFSKGNEIGTEGAQYIAYVLEKNSKITSLNIGGKLHSE
jgi:hypothetical protein